MKSYLVFILSLISLVSHAHDGHVHEPAVEAPPHGGLLRDAPPFKGEIVLSGDRAKLYIYDMNLNPVKLDKDSLKGELQFPRDKKARPVSFTRKGDHYETKLSGIAKVHRFDMHVHLVVGKKKALADFGIDNVQ